MRIAVLKESAPGETRVAATPETVKKIVALGHTVSVEAGAGEGAAAPDQHYKDAGAEISADGGIAGADLVVKVRRPTDSEIAKIKPGAGFGDYLWFGLPIYDDRFRMPPAYKEQDTADTKKFIYTCAAADIATESTHDHKWVKFDRDLQPLIRRAMETAWSRGFLTFSRRIADYHIAGFFLGWEVPGIFDVEVQVRDLCLRV